VLVSEEPEQVVEVLLQAMLHAQQVLDLDLVDDDVAFADVEQWFERHRERILLVLEHAVRHFAPEEAASLLARTWAIVPVTIDRQWVEAVRDCGRALGGVLPTSRTMATVFRRSAEVAFTSGEYLVAEVEGMRELAIWRQLDEPDNHVDALDSLMRTYLARDRLHRAMDCADERLAVDLAADRTAAVAEDLQLLGTLMLQAGRYDTAVDYLTRVIAQLDQQPELPAQQRANARVLLGRALWHSGTKAKARRQFSDALDLLVGVDDDLAGHVRELLETGPQDSISAEGS
jgi:tetratricopeptide (TPR) repeat protein